MEILIELSYCFRPKASFSSESNSSAMNAANAEF